MGGIDMELSNLIAQIKNKTIADKINNNKYKVN